LKKISPISLPLSFTWSKSVGSFLLKKLNIYTPLSRKAMCYIIVVNVFQFNYLWYDIKMQTTIINCDCMCHSLHVRPDVESKTVDISLWNYGFNDGKLHWKKRLQILMDGFAYSDLVVLDKEELNKLIAVLEDARGKLA
jgi:hypothetical protein